MLKSSEIRKPPRDGRVFLASGKAGSKPFPRWGLRSLRLAIPYFCVVFLPAQTTNGPLGEFEPLVTDRPDFTESAETVAPGRVQLEAGYTFSANEGDKQSILGEPLLRVGLRQQIELRLSSPSLLWTDSPGGDMRGFGAMSIGFKAKVVEGPGRSDPIRPDVAVIVATTLPTGDEDLGEDKLEPEVKLALAWELSERFSLASNLNYAYAGEDDIRFHQFSGSLSLSYALTEKWGSYVEYFGFVPESEKGPNASFFNGGLTYLVTNDFLLDVRAGAGLGRANPEHFAGLGLSWRW